MEIKAIQTEYKGYLFRSRLEARWAIFFDACNMEWEYEPEGLVFEDGVNYLPDFLVHGVIEPDYDYNDSIVREWEEFNWKRAKGEILVSSEQVKQVEKDKLQKLRFVKKDVFFEVKPNKELSEKEEEKIMHLVSAHRPIVVLSDIPTVLEQGESSRWREYKLGHWSPYKPILNTFTLEGTKRNGKFCGHHINLDCFKNERGKKKLAITRNNAGSLYFTLESPRKGEEGFIARALTVARQARFEFGETPHLIKERVGRL